MEENDAVAEGLLENLDDLAGEGDFGDEEDDGGLGLKGLSSEFKVKVGFTATSHTSE